MKNYGLVLRTVITALTLICSVIICILLGVLGRVPLGIVVAEGILVLALFSEVLFWLAEEWHERMSMRNDEQLAEQDSEAFEKQDVKAEGQKRLFDEEYAAGINCTNASQTRGLSDFRSREKEESEQEKGWGREEETTYSVKEPAEEPEPEKICEKQMIDLKNQLVSAYMNSQSWPIDGGSSIAYEDIYLKEPVSDIPKGDILLYNGKSNSSFIGYDERYLMPRESLIGKPWGDINRKGLRLEFSYDFEPKRPENEMKLIKVYPAEIEVHKKENDKRSCEVKQNGLFIFEK